MDLLFRCGEVFLPLGLEHAGEYEHGDDDHDADHGLIHGGHDSHGVDAVVAGALGSDGGEVAEELVGEAGEDDKLEAVGEARSHGAAPAAESVAHDARDAAGEEGADDGNQRHNAEECG